MFLYRIYFQCSGMASTARSKDETTEYFDSPEELDRKVTLLAQWVRESKHMMAFTVRLRREAATVQVESTPFLS